MSDLLSAISSNDLVKFARCFNEGMSVAIGKVLEEEKHRIALQVMVEGEEPNDDDDENDDDENKDDDENDDDEDD